MRYGPASFFCMWISSCPGIICWMACSFPHWIILVSLLKISCPQIRTNFWIAPRVLKNLLHILSPHVTEGHHNLLSHPDQTCWHQTLSRLNHWLAVTHQYLVVPRNSKCPSLLPQCLSFLTVFLMIWVCFICLWPLHCFLSSSHSHLVVYFVLLNNIPMYGCNPSNPVSPHPATGINSIASFWFPCLKRKPSHVSGVFFLLRTSMYYLVCKILNSASESQCEAAFLSLPCDFPLTFHAIPYPLGSGSSEHPTVTPAFKTAYAPVQSLSLCL